MTSIGIGVFTAPEAGGAYQYTRAMLEAASVICSRYQNEYEFTVYSMYPLWEEICKNIGVRFKLLKNSKGKKIIYHIGHILGRIGLDNTTLYNQHPLWEMYDEDKLDLMIITSPTWYGKPKGKKCIIPIFDLMHRYIDFEEVGGGNIGKERDRRYMSICTHADGILTDSKLGVMQVIDCYGDNVKNLIAKTYALPFIVPDYIKPDAKGEAVSVPDKYILYPAQFWKHKNHINLLKAVAELKKQGMDIRLVFTGTNKNAASDIENAIKENELSTNIINLGYVSDEQLVYLYKHARAMIFPSFGGPTNIPPLEAMALGCPVAVSNNFAMPEQVGSAGLTFAPDDIDGMADCMRRMWNDDELCEKLSKNGLERSKLWTVNEFAEALCDIIKSVEGGGLNATTSDNN